jgi:hypothetical protein
VRRRRIAPKIDFSAGVADGYHFRVPDAFRVALDIHCLERVDRQATRRLREKAKAAGIDDKKMLLRLKISHMLWLQGSPPLYAFRATDIITTPDDSHALQVVASCFDQFDKKTGKIDGQVTFNLFNGHKRAGLHQCSQSEFNALLKTGRCARLGLDLTA